MFSATVKTGTSMKCWWTMPMPRRDGVTGVGEMDRLPVDADLAGVGVHQAEQDVHERGLAGAVLPEEAVDFARLEGEVHAVVSQQRPERSW